MAKKKKTFKDYTAFSAMSAELVLKNFTFVCFLSFLALIYIANAHYSEKKVRQIQQLQKELKQMRWKYMSLVADFTHQTKRSEVIRQVKDEGVKPNKKKPVKIIVKQDP